MRAELSPAEKEKLLRDLWVAHDGRWFLKTAEEYGFDSANKLNQAVIRSMGKKEARELMVRTGTQIAGVSDIKAFMNMAGELYWPGEHKYAVETVGDDLLVGHVIKCYVWENSKKAGALGLYRCAAAIRFSGWMDAMVVPAEVTGSGDCDTCNGSCDISFRFDWPQNPEGGNH
jgi:hypothetical protein